MRLRYLVVLLGLLLGGAAQGGNDVQADYRAVPSLRHHLPINIPEAASLSEEAMRDLECLSWNLYFEARGGTRAEQIAVAYVPINRSASPRFSRDICTNVFQYGWAGGRRQYQFSWAGTVRGPNWRREDETWIRMQRIALDVYTRQVRDTANGATHFHHSRIGPSRGARNVITLGSHVFWRM